MRLFLLLALPAVALATGAQQLVGGPMKVDELSAKHQEIVQYAFSQIAQGDCPRKIVRVENFTTQVVAGASYAFDLVLVNTGDNCDKTMKTCRLKVWEKTWENFKKVTVVKCLGQEKLKLITDTD